MIMTNLVFTGESNQVLTNSLLVAEKFGKEHRNIIASIRDILAAENSAANYYSETTYVNRGKEYPMFLMNRDGFTLLIMGFTGKEAMDFKIQFLQAFNEMENRLKNSLIPKSFPEALRLAAMEAEKVEELERQILLDAPKVQLATAFEASKGSCLIGELAKLLTQNGYEIGQNRLFDWLRDNDYLCKSGEARNQPTQKYVEMNLFELKKTVFIHGEETRSRATTLVTSKGQSYFINKFLNSNTLPA